MCVTVKCMYKIFDYILLYSLLAGSIMIGLIGMYSIYTYMKMHGEIQKSQNLFTTIYILICLHCQSFKFEVDMPYTGKPNTWGNAELLSFFQVASEESQSHWQQMLDMFKLKQLARWHSEDLKGYLFA